MKRPERVSKGLTQGSLCAIAKHYLGYGSKMDTSIYTLAAKVLEIHGVVRQWQKNDRSFVTDNYLSVKELKAKIPKKEKVKPVKPALLLADIIKARDANTAPIKTKAKVKKLAAINPVVKKQITKTTYEAANADSFLASYEWRKIRLIAIKLHGRKCLCCGASPETGAVLNVDHIKPRRTHPELALEITNLQVLCHECNHGKGSWDTTDFRK